MGLIKSKRTNEHDYVNVHQWQDGNRSPSLLASCSFRRAEDPFRPSVNTQRFCSKKKVLILGLDRSGKTDLFRRLTAHEKQRAGVDTLPQPTMGYNVETIRLRCRHVCQWKYYKVTLWDCGGHAAVRSLWSYHYSNTSLLLWLINIHDRSRLDANLQLLSQVLTNSILCRVPVLIVLYNASFDHYEQSPAEEETKENVLTNLEVAFRFLATLSTSRASSFKWQVINVTLTARDSRTDLKKIRQCFRELMEL